MISSGLTISNSATDNCGLPGGTIYTPIFFSYTCNNIGINEFPFSATDIYGNVGRCTTIVTLLDSTAPRLYCPNDSTCNAATLTFSVTSYDYCGANLVQTDNSSLSSGGLFPNGTTTLSYRATDDSGNVDSCSFSITVQDTISPVMNCPGDTVLYADSRCDAIFNYTVSSSDNCGARHFQIDQSGFTAGDNFVKEVFHPRFNIIYGGAQEWVAIDSSGNTDTCRFNVSVLDTVPPRFVICPTSQVISTEPGRCGSANYSATIATTDNCNLISERLDTTSFSFGSFLPIGTYLFSYRRADDFGNADTCTFTMTVQDTESPELHCPNDTIIFADTSCSATLNYTVSSSDNCGARHFQIDTTGLSSGSIFTMNQDSILQAWVAIDSAGNTDTCSFWVHVADSIAPRFSSCPNDIRVQVDSGACDASVFYSAPFSDNCTAFLQHIDASGLSNGDRFAIGTTLQFLRAYDEAGNADTCIFGVTVFDTIAPEIHCPNDTVVYSTPTNCSVTLNYTISATDNCGVIRIDNIDNSGINQRSPFSFPVGVSFQELVAIDGSRNTDTCAFSVTVLDTIPPTDICPRNSTFDADSNSCGKQFDPLLARIWRDNCGIDQLIPSDTRSQRDIARNYYPVGVTTQGLLVSDPSGNAVRCTWTRTIRDVTAPVLSCPSDTLVIADSTQCGTVVDYPLSAYDACGYSLRHIDSSGLQKGSFFPVGEHIQSVVAEDTSGNSDTCTFQITVEDRTPPVVTCEFDSVTVFLDSGACKSFYPFKYSFVDNCGADTLISLLRWPIGQHTEVVGHFDGTFYDSCTIIVTVLDTTKPVIHCPSDTVVAADTTCGFVWNYAVQAADDCGLAQFSQTDSSGYTAGDSFPLGTTIQTWIAEDSSQNKRACTFRITVNDSSAPSLICPAQLTVANDSALCGAVVSYQISSSDNCSATHAQTDTSGLTSGSFFPIGTTIQSYRATDPSGNTVDCSFSIMVSDTGKPVIVCPVSIVVNNDSGMCGAVVSYQISSSDNCSASHTQVDGSGLSSGSLFPVGTKRQTWQATDLSGNTDSCSFDVTVIDNEPPVVICQDVTVYLDSTGFTRNLNVFQNGAFISQSDNCSTVGNVGVTGPRRYTCNELGARPTTIIQDDPSGNEYRCRFNYIVVDSTRPTAVCQNMTVFLDSSNLVVINPSDIGGGSTDNCSIILSSSGTSFGCSDIGANAVVLTAADASGNTDTCTSIITVSDSTDPVIICPANIAVSSDSGMCGAFISYQISSSDNCSASNAQNDTSGLTSGSLFPVGTTTQSYLATDASGNSTSCSFTVTVSDTAAPLIDIGSTVVNLCQFSPWVDPGYTASDLCDGDLSAHVQVSGSVNTNVPGSYYLHYDLIDAAGNIAIRQTRQVIVGPTPRATALQASVCPGTRVNIAALVRDYSILARQFSFYASGVQLAIIPAFRGVARYPVPAMIMSDTSFMVLATGANGCADTLHIQVTIRNCASTRLTAKVLLQGAYDLGAGRMRDDLRSRSLIPMTEPYSAMGYQYVGGGGEAMQSGVLATTGSNAIVDWLVVELRDSADARQIAYSRAALLQADGDIVDTDGSSVLSIDSLPAGSYYIAIWHRNHLGVMTAQPLRFDGSNLSIDFSDPLVQVYGAAPTRQISNGAALLLSGDADHNGQIQNTDNIMRWIPEVGTQGYKAADFNLDGQVQNTDLIYYWMHNAARGSAVPR